MCLDFIASSLSGCWKDAKKGKMKDKRVLEQREGERIQGPSD